MDQDNDGLRRKYNKLFMPESSNYSLLTHSLSFSLPHSLFFPLYPSVTPANKDLQRVTPSCPQYPQLQLTARPELQGIRLPANGL